MHNIGRSLKKGLFGDGGSSSSEPVQFPGLFSRQQGRSFGNRAASAVGSFQPLQFGQQDSPFSQALRNAILNPQVGSFTGGQQNLLDAITQLAAGSTQGRAASLGRGASPVTTSQIRSNVARSVAPQLVNFRQNQIGNLLSGQQLAQQDQQSLRTAQLQSFAQLLQSKGIDQQTLLELARLGQPVTAQKSQGTGASPGIIEPLNPKDVVKGIASIG